MPKDDPLYAQLKTLQSTGETLNQQGTSLNTVLGAETEGQFESDLKDSFDDVLTEHDEGIDRTSGAGLAVAGVLGMVGGATLATGGAVACAPTAGLSCAAVPVGVGIAVVSEQSGEEGLHKALDPYTPREGQGVLNSLSEATHEGDINPSKDLAISLGIMTAEAATAKFGSKLLDRALDGKVVNTVVVGDEAVVGNVSAVGNRKAVAEAGDIQESLSSEVSNNEAPIWNAINATKADHPGSVIPQSFELTLENNQKIWVDGNATKHLAEYADYKAENYTPESVKLASQVQLGSLKSAVEKASTSGIKYREVINVDGWELVFAPPKTADQFPVLYHAVYKSR